MPRILYLMRHAEPIVFAGQKQGLSTVGKEQARLAAIALRRRIPRVANAVVVHSPALRCKETAAILGARFKVLPIDLPLRFENAQNLETDDTQSKYSAYINNYLRDGVESPDDYLKRFLAIINLKKDRIPVIVANEVNIRVVLQLLGGNTYNTPVEHTACFKVEIKKHQEQATIERVV